MFLLVSKFKMIGMLLKCSGLPYKLRLKQLAADQGIGFYAQFFMVRCSSIYIGVACSLHDSDPSVFSFTL